MGSNPDIVVTSPSDGRVVGTLAAHGLEDVDIAFQRSRKAQQQWAEVPVRQRAKIGLRLHDLVMENQSRLMDVIQAETGKNRSSAFEEILDTANTARHYGFSAPRILRDRRARGPMPLLNRTVVQRRPVGVVGVIAPWNYPLSFAVADVIPALIAGNGVVLKPDVHTPHTALAAGELLLKSGVPDGLLHVLPGIGIEVGQAIAAQCDYLMFTGSTKTGRILGQVAGERLIGYTAELSGKNPMIVLPDADIAEASRGARHAAFSASGQMCISAERIYVHTDIYDEFKRRFLADVKQMSVGIGKSWEIDMGSLISANHVEEVDGVVQDAVQRGATLLTGGVRLSNIGPAFYAPTVLENVPHDAILRTEEVFGPVVYLQRVTSVDEAVELANESEYGLNASVFGSRKQALAVAQRLNSGSVCINDGYVSAWASADAPMGGWKQSGVGRRHGDQGLLSFTEARTIAEQRFMPALVHKPENLTGSTFSTGLSKLMKYGKYVLR
ncbi:Putative succinate-semialdehyde dehydrogenase [NADP(+)] 2 [Corynebacterium choanae]|uniref:Succinate-semialdehyde dehydrogenase [NADP(+)] 2 n=2 Tax=Corynebacterium choanae TaxID=1862358 RepID=A0A3G6J695_9CORY|nr:Putative succinate-semialdehyde dehydrogenase [NADP(+)] 2 [Corynebacterium choanae]